MGDLRVDPVRRHCENHVRQVCYPGQIQDIRVDPVSHRWKEPRGPEIQRRRSSSFWVHAVLVPRNARDVGPFRLFFADHTQACALR